MYLKIDLKIGIQNSNSSKKVTWLIVRWVFICPTGFNIYHIIISQTSTIMQPKAKELR